MRVTNVTFTRCLLLLLLGIRCMPSSKKLFHGLTVALTTTGMNRWKKTGIYRCYHGEILKVRVVVGYPRLQRLNIVWNLAPAEPKWNESFHHVLSQMKPAASRDIGNSADVFPTEIDNRG